MKALAKKTVRLICRLLVLPAVMTCRLQVGLIGADAAFAGWPQLFSLLPGLTGEYLRHAFYEAAAGRCDEDACISFGTIASHQGICIGRSAFIGSYCSLGNVTIEQDVLIASHVSVMNGCRQHGTSRLDIPIREQPGKFLPVTIGEGSWIGERATIAADVGRQCIVGAGSLVLQPLPDYAVAVGSPARIIGDRRQMTTDEQQTSTGAVSDEPLLAGRC